MLFFLFRVSAILFQSFQALWQWRKRRENNYFSFAKNGKRWGRVKKNSETNEGRKERKKERKEGKREGKEPGIMISFVRNK